jgi:hypothetical protein
MSEHNHQSETEEPEETEETDETEDQQNTTEQQLQKLQQTQLIHNNNANTNNTPIKSLNNNSLSNGVSPNKNLETPNSFHNEKPEDLYESSTPNSSEKPPERKAGRRKINIEFIDDKSRRHITFSKRKAGIMKKAYELSALTGTQVLLLVASETGHVYTFATPKLQPLITKPEGKNLIQTCLNAPDLPINSHPN